MNFLNDSWAWALLLGIAPFVIHYLLRKQNKRRWGAMSILLRVYQRNRRRRRLEELLLLLLRMAIMLLFALAMMRPELSTASSALSMKNDPVVIVLDTSLSTSRRYGLNSVLDRLKENCIRYIKTLPQETDLSLVLTPGDEPIVRRNRQSLIESVKNAEVHWLDGHMERVVKKVKDELHQRGLGSCQLEIFSDFQKSDFEKIDEWPSHWELKFHQIILPKKENVKLTAFKASSGLPSIHSPWSAEVTVQGPAGSVSLSASDEGKTLFEKDITIPSSGKITVPLSFSFSQEGWHRLELSVPDDMYSFDNKQYLAVDVSSKIRVLVLSSFKSDDYLVDETIFFEKALNPREREIDIVSQSTPPEVMEGYDIYILVNVDRLSGDVVKKLNEEVENGSFLALYCGSRTDKEFIKKSFPYLPELGEKVHENRKFFPDTGGIFRLWSGYFKPYQFKNYYCLSNKGQAQLNDADQNIVVASGHHGTGVWMMSGFALNFSYGDWVASPLYVSFARSIITKFSHPRHVGLSWVCIEGQRPEWSIPGFVNEEGLIVAVNAPTDESDGETVSEESWQLNDTQATVVKNKQSMALTLLAILMALLFVETLWNARRT